MSQKPLESCNERETFVHVPPGIYMLSKPPPDAEQQTEKKQKSQLPPAVINVKVNNDGCVSYAHGAFAASAEFMIRCGNVAYDPATHTSFTDKAHWLLKADTPRDVEQEKKSDDNLWAYARKMARLNIPIDVAIDLVHNPAEQRIRVETMFRYLTQ